MRRLSVLLSFLLTSCFQTYNTEDADMRTVPVTNNPYVIPSHGNGVPMMGDRGPY